MLISRRREAKRRALLQMLDRIPARNSGKVPPAAVRVSINAPVDAPLAAGAPSSEGIPRVKQ